MQSAIRAVVVAAALTVPVISFAQSNSPVTRAQVRAELVQLEQAGWRPSAGADPHYPDDLLAAEAKVAAANAQASGYGGAAPGTSQAGGPAISKADWNAMYSHP